MLYSTAMRVLAAAALLALASCSAPTSDDEAAPRQTPLTGSATDDAPRGPGADDHAFPSAYGGKKTGSADAGPARETRRDGTPGDPGSRKPVLIDFTRDHCLPCDLMAPWLEEVRRSHCGSLDVTEINIDRPENKEIGAHFKVKSIPTQVYVDSGGKEVLRHVGLATRPQMEATLRKLGFIE